MKTWKEENLLYKMKESSGRITERDFDSILEKIYKGEFEILNVKRKSYSNGTADIKVDVPSLRGKRLEVEWNSNSSWYYPESASRLYYNIYKDNISEDDPLYWELKYSHDRWCIDEDDENYNRKEASEVKLSSAISSYIKEHEKEI